MARNTGKSIREILSEKKASIKDAPLPSGSPSWADILEEPWEGIEKKAKMRLPGYKTIRKLFSDPEYDK